MSATPETVNIIDIIYPATRPTSILRFLYTPFNKYLARRHTTRVIAPTKRLYHAPKSSAPVPQPHESIPTDKRESPMLQTLPERAAVQMVLLF